MNNSLLIFVKAMVPMLLSLCVACAPSTNKQDTEPKKSCGEITLETAIEQELISYVSAEVDTRGTADMVVDFEGWTALHYASTFGSVKVVALLLSRGANPNIRNSWGDFPISHVWNHIHSKEGCLAVSEGTITMEEAAKYEAILQMLARPERKIQPRSVEAEDDAIREALLQHFEGRPREKDYYLNVNGRDVEAETLGVLRADGHQVFPFSEIPPDKNHHEMRCKIEWMTNTVAELEILEQYDHTQGKLTYAYGYWMFESEGTSHYFIDNGGALLQMNDEQLKGLFKVPAPQLPFPENLGEYQNR